MRLRGRGRKDSGEELWVMNLHDLAKACTAKGKLKFSKRFGVGRNRRAAKGKPEEEQDWKGR